jgi:transcriptional regulator with XRE-family HTH domain
VGTQVSVNKIIGLRLKMRRNNLGITQSDLGNKLGVTFQQIQKYEKGQSNISIHKLLQISEILKIPVDYFLGEEDREEALQEELFQITKNMDKASRSNKEAVVFLKNFLQIKNKRMRLQILTLIKIISKGTTNSLLKNEEK